MINYIQNFYTKVKTIIFVLRYSINIKFIFRLLRGYLRVNLLNKNQIRLVEIFLTLTCNAKCKFCANGLYTEKKAALSIEEYLRIIDECAELNVPVIVLIGGETLLYKDLGILIKRIRSHGIMSMVGTNGYLIDEKKVKELAGYGLDSLVATLLSPDEEEHDSVVGLKGCYRKIMQAKKICSKFNIYFSIATVVSHKDFTSGRFDRLVKLAFDNKLPLNINPIIPTGLAKDVYEDLLTCEDVEKVNSLSRTSSYITTHLSNNYFGFGCPAGNSYLGIYITGDIFPCYFFPVSLGNIKQMTLKDAWQKACKSPLFTKKHKMCFAGVSREFVKEYLNPIFSNFNKVPIPIEEHPKYDAQLQAMQDLKSSKINNAVNDQ